MTLVETDGKFYKVEIDENILKTPGMFLGQSENRCYLGVFPNNATETDEEFRNHWVLGSKFLNQFYVVFDASNFEDGLQVGIGLKNASFTIE